MDILLVIGLAFVFGFGGGKLCEKFQIPQVIGFIVIGLLLGASVSGVITIDQASSMEPITKFTLGLIGFMVGGELDKTVFRKFGRSIISILLVESLATFFLVTMVIWFFSGKLYLALLLGALATATDPAATMNVIWEYKAKGPLSSTLAAIVGLDDVLALIIYAFSVSLAKILLTGESASWGKIILHPIVEIASSVGFGSLLGFGLAYGLSFIRRDKKEFVPITLGAILIATGGAEYLHLSSILVNMFMGITLVNFNKRASLQVTRSLAYVNPTIYMFFFVCIGSKLNPALLPQMGMLGILYILARMTGKLAGATVGARLGKATESVQKYLGMALFSQAGIAIGLALAVFQEFSKLGPAGREVGILVMNVITATTFVVQVIGPPCVKLAISRAGEIPAKAGS